MSLLEQRVLLLDCQTTGTSATHDRLLEIAWVWTSALDSYPPVVQSALLAVPGELPKRVTDLTGIRAEDLAEGLTTAEAWRDFHGAAAEGGSGAFAVAHYAQFERPFLKRLYEDAGEGAELSLPVICTYRIAKRLFPKAPSGNIRGLAGYFGYDLGEIRRARDHVLGTALIWQRIATDLHRLGVESLAGLEAWLAKKAPRQVASTEFRVDRAKRLALPKGPGIYRMLAKNGEILYVGKATSLRDRVNSYFRGGCTGDRRKLEMLARAWDVEVEECATALEAALRENDEIKRLRPHYNRALLPSERPLVFYSRDFTEFAGEQSERHPLGPFRQGGAVEQVGQWVYGQAIGDFSGILYEEFSAESLCAGFSLFCEAHGLDPLAPLSARKLLAMGLRALRAEVEEPGEESGEEGEEGEIPEPEEIAGKFARLLRGAAREYRRAKKLGQLLNAEVSWDVGQGEWRSLRFAEGRPSRKRGSATLTLHPWRGLGPDDYDRVSVLYAELKRRPHRIEARPPKDLAGPNKKGHKGGKRADRKRHNRPELDHEAVL